MALTSNLIASAVFAVGVDVDVILVHVLVAVATVRALLLTPAPAPPDTQPLGLASRRRRQLLGLPPHHLQVLVRRKVLQTPLDELEVFGGRVGVREAGGDRGHGEPAGPEEGIGCPVEGELRC